MIQILSIVMDFGFNVLTFQLETGNGYYRGWFINVPAEVQVARVLSTVSLIAGLISLLASIKGQPCMKDCVHRESMIQANKIASCLTLVSSVLITIGSVYFAYIVAEEYKATLMVTVQPASTKVKRFVWGNCIYLCWASAVSYLVGGVIALSSKLHMENHADDYNFDSTESFEKTVYHVTPATV